MQVAVEHGELRGFDADGVAQFRGVPFAAPPRGERRFLPPQPAEPWKGVRDTTRWGARAPQSLAPQPFRRVVDVPVDEDCLTLNVFTPAGRSGTEPAGRSGTEPAGRSGTEPATEGAPRPVMVWIHGGAFNIGSGCLFDAAELARRGDVVVVTVNYRLGALGFTYLDHLDERFAGSGNVALLDQIAALEWVRANVAAFGGDPGNVTIFGESSGGHSVGCLLTATAARGLFHRAIAQSSAGFGLREVDQAVAQTTALMDQLGVTSAEELQAVPADRVVDAQAGFSFSPVLDGIVLTDHVLDAVAADRCADVPLLISHTRDEMRLFAANGRALGALPADDDDLTDRLALVFADGRAAAGAYRAAEPDATPAELWLSFLTDQRFHMPDFRLAEARVSHNTEVWMARFSWPSTAMDGRLGACHAIEIPFLFTGGGNLGGMTPDDGPPRRLAHAIQDAWVAFARLGDPNTAALPEWPRYDRAQRLVMELDDECSVLADPDGDIRRLWPATADV
jgi:para-nitrobenzyl esterase